MTDAPKKLEGLELLRHAKTLLEGIEAGETVQIFLDDINEWVNAASTFLTFERRLDLYRLKPKKQIGYANVYTEQCPLHPSRRIADISANFRNNRIACVRVEYESGQFDD